MPRERLRYHEDAAARPDYGPRDRPGGGSRRKHAVELAKAFDSRWTIPSRKGLKHCIEFDVMAEPMGSAAQADDFRPYRKGSQQLRTLQRLGLLRQRGAAGRGT